MQDFEYGTCKACQATTAVSVNTMTERGLLCTQCRVNEATRQANVRPLDARIAALEQELQQLYVTRAWYASTR